MEDYITDLIQKVEKLELIQVDMKVFLKQSNTTTVISERQKRNDKLTKAHMIDTVTRFDCDERVLGKNGGSYLKYVPLFDITNMISNRRSVFFTLYIVR